MVFEPLSIQIEPVAGSQTIYVKPDCFESQCKSGANLAETGATISGPERSKQPAGRGQEPKIHVEKASAAHEHAATGSPATIHWQFSSAATVSMSCDN
jgi:hypothetical protein